MKAIQLGTAQTDITPQGTPELSGYVRRIQPAVGVHDAILARGVYLYNSEGDRLLWLHADVLCFANGFVDHFKNALLAEHGLRRDQVVLSATHTHAAPTTVPLLNAGEPEPGFEAMLGERMMALAEAAMVKPREVRMMAGAVDAPLAVDRRGGPSAHVDPRLSVVGWRQEDGDWAAVLVNFPMHNVMLSHDNRRISGDVAGFAARWLQENLPGMPVVLWTNGAAANLNPPYKTTDFDKVRELGERLAHIAAEALQAARPLGNQGIQSAAETVPIPLNDLETSRRFARQYLAELENSHRNANAIPDSPDPIEYSRTRQADSVRRWEELVDQQSAAGTLPCTLPMEVQVVRIGPAVFACFAGEMFSCIREEISDGAGRDVVVVGYANGYNGYLSTPAAFDEGGYEPDESFIYGGIPRVAPGAHELARDRAVRMIRALE